MWDQNWIYAGQNGVFDFCLNYVKFLKKIFLTYTFLKKGQILKKVGNVKNTIFLSSLPFALRL